MSTDPFIGKYYQISTDWCKFLKATDVVEDIIEAYLQIPFRINKIFKSADNIKFAVVFYE